MSEQLDFYGGFAQVPSGSVSTLTRRMTHALATIGRLQPITSDELGAHMHAYRLEHGGKGHDPDTRCDRCGSEGKDVGEALKRRGLVVRKKTIGWCLPDYQAAEPAPSASGVVNPGIPF